MQNDLQKYFLTQLEIFNENFIVSLKGFDVTAIHKMRLSIKRIRVLFQFIEFLTPENFKAKEQLKKIKKLFKLAGKIRDVQIQLQLFELYKKELNINFKDYYNFLKDKELKAITDFNENLGYFDENQKIIDQEKINKTLDQALFKDFQSGSLKFLNKKITIINHLKSDLSNNKNIHRIRTILKQIYYLLEILENNISEKLFLNVSKERLKEIENIIGKWHDRVNADNFLYLFLIEKNHTANQDYALFRERINHEKSLLFQKTEKSLTSELKFDMALKL